jgi:hypothetical protein
MERGKFYQQFEEQNENGQQENPLSFDALFQDPVRGERRGLQRTDPFQLLVTLNDLTLSTETIPRTPIQHRAIYKVRTALSILSYPFLEAWQREVVQDDIETSRQLQKRKRVKLTPFERGILNNMASMVGVPCNPQQRRYNYSAIPRSPRVEF